MKNVSRIHEKPLDLMRDSLLNPHDFWMGISELAYGIEVDSHSHFNISNAPNPRIFTDAIGAAFESSPVRRQSMFFAIWSLCPDNKNSFLFSLQSFMTAIYADHGVAYFFFKQAETLFFNNSPFDVHSLLLALHKSEWPQDEIKKAKPPSALAEKVLTSLKCKYLNEEFSLISQEAQRFQGAH